MKPTVCIETTIVGHLTSRIPKDQLVAANMLETRQWWVDARPQFTIFISGAVIDEIANGDPVAAAERMQAVAGIPLLAVDERSIALANRLIVDSALPVNAKADAIHLAVATANGLDYLMTWNCRHLANASMRRKIENTCRAENLEPPIICTPPQLMESLG
jgi:hypothetical protein